MSFAYFFYFVVSLQVFLFITRNNQIKELLHLSTDFQYQNLYKSIVKGMSELGFQQCIFIQHRGSLIKKYNYNYTNTQNFLVIESRLKDKILESENFFSEYDKTLILNKQIMAILNHVPFTF